MLCAASVTLVQGEADAKEIKIKQKGISSSAATVKKPRKFDSKY
jgi:hypothetical protein